MAKYIEEEEDDYKQRAKEWLKNKSEKGRFKLPEGDSTIRLLKTPADPKRHSPGLSIEYKMHQNVGPNKRFMRCGQTLSGKGDCWLCNKIEELKDKGKNKLARSLEAQAMLEVQVAVVDQDSGKWRGPLRWYLRAGGAKSLAYSIMTLIGSAKRDYVDPKAGYNFTIERTGTGPLDTRYSQPVPDDKPTKVPNAIMERLKPFLDVVPEYEEDVQKAAYFGREDEEEESTEDEEEEPRAKRRGHEEEEEEEKPRRRGKSADEEEMKGSDGEEEAESDEEEAKPRSKKRPHDEETEPEEEEEAPRKKAKRPRDEEEEPEEEEEKPRGKVKRPRDEEEAEPDEEEEKPRGKAKRPRDADEEEFEIDTETEEEAEERAEEEETGEEEEEAPRKKPKPKRK